MNLEEPRHSDLTLIRRMLLEARPFWGRIVVIFFVGLISIPLSLLGPLPLKIAVDNVIGSEPLPAWVKDILPDAAQTDIGLLIFVIAFLLTLALVNGLHGLGSSLLKTSVSERMLLDFRGKIFRHIQRLSIAYHDEKGTTDASYRIQYDAGSIQRLSMDTVIPFLRSVVTLVAMIYVIARIDFELAIVALLISPPLFLTVKLYRQPLRIQWRRVKNLEQAAWKVMHEVLGALRVVKAFGQEAFEHARFVERYDEGVQARLRIQVVQGTYGLLVGLLSAGGTAAVLFIGVTHVIEGTLTLGALLVVMSYLSKLIGPLRTMGRQVTGLQGALAGAERSFALLDQAPDVYEKPDAMALDRSKGIVDVSGVSFSYIEGQPIIRDVSFHVPFGTRVGIAGKTGAGKTTLVNLLTRFYDPDSGVISIDGVDIRDYRVDDYRNQFAIVLQEPVLFSTSIAENIAYARPGASEDEIIEAARMANAHEFIMGFDEGYETLVGHRGMRLSGGERQRIGLARAFLKNAPILILDEPTSSVDMETESVIIDAMDRLMAGRTTFMIAHRLTTLEQCDMLIVLENGRLVKETSEVSKVVRDALEAGSLEASLAEAER